MSAAPDAGRQRWGRPSVVAAMRELLTYGAWVAGGDNPPTVTLTLRHRASVQAREWWQLSWHDADGGEHSAESQYLDVLLRRAAQWCEVDDVETANQAEASTQLASKRVD